jgi:methylglutaconyl-CoA hydratase
MPHGGRRLDQIVDGTTTGRAIHPASQARVRVAAMDQLVHLDVAGGTATITLDSPANRNALSAQVRRELSAHLEAVIEDDAVRVVVLTHTGPVFCSGMDLRESRGAGSSDQGVNEFPAILTALWTSDTPVVARLAGPARAGGIGLVAACDIAVAAREATFAFSEVRIGVVPAVISSTVLPRMLPRAAHELMLTGEVFDADRAAAVGLINRAVDADGLDAEVARYTDMLVRGGPRALAATKAMLRRDRGEPLQQDLQAMLDLSAEFFASEEGQEGMAAFAEKRAPSWVLDA